MFGSMPFYYQHIKLGFLLDQDSLEDIVVVCTESKEAICDFLEVEAMGAGRATSLSAWTTFEVFGYGVPGRKSNGRSPTLSFKVKDKKTGKSHDTSLSYVGHPSTSRSRYSDVLRAFLNELLRGDPTIIVFANTMVMDKNYRRRSKRRTTR